MIAPRNIKRLQGRQRAKRGGHAKQTDELDRSDPLGLAILLDAYLEHLAIKNFSEKTIENRQSNVTYLLQWLKERSITAPAAVTKPILESYQRMLYRYRKKNDKPLGFTTQRNRLSAVKQYFAWLCKQNYILSNPASEIELPKADKRLPQMGLSHEEVELVLSQPDLSDPLGVRDRAILELFYSTGIRRSELVSLQLQDLDTTREVLMVRQGKGGKDRLLPIGKRALKWTEKYLHEVRPHLLYELGEEALFLSGYGEAFNRDFLSRMVRHYIEEAELGKSGSCHLLRHSMATLMLENGADVRYVQEMLGHAQLSTTEIYTHVSIKKLQQIHAMTHPAQ